MGDIFDELPSSSQKGCVDEIKKLVSEKLYLELTAKDEAAVVRAQKSAKIKASSMLKLVDVKLDETLDLHRQIVGWLTVYFLYVFNGSSSSENEWLIMAKDLIANHYGADELKAVAAPSGSVAQSIWQNRYKK